MPESAGLTTTSPDLENGNGSAYKQVAGSALPSRYCDIADLDWFMFPFQVSMKRARVNRARDYSPLRALISAIPGIQNNALDLRLHTRQHGSPAYLIRMVLK